MTETTVDESTPLLATPDTQKDRALVYERFSPVWKRVIVLLVSWCGLLPLFVGGVLNVSIPTIAAEFESSTELVSLCVSMAVVATAIGSLVAAPNSTYYGRRPIYLFYLPIFVMGSAGVVFSRTVYEMMFFRVVQAIGSSPGISIGGATISDIYPLEQRGFAMGVFHASILLGVPLGPLFGGLAAHFGSWRAMQAILGIAGIIGFVAMFTFFPETSHPGTRGKDLDIAAGRSGFRFVNPLKVLALLKSPTLVFVSIVGLTVLLDAYMIVLSLAETLEGSYGISNQAFLGLCFLPLGCGNMIGAPVAGRISDHIVVTWRAKRGSWYPEDRLRAALFGILFLVPVSTIAMGLIVEIIPGTVGLVLLMVGMFFNGIGVDTVLTPCSAYCVDVLHQRSAEAMAAMMGFRALGIGIFASFMVPLIHSVGIGWAYAIVSFVVWLGALLLVLTIRHGERLRSSVNISYSTTETN
ncbi:MFS general substrate transporter [Flagelloscypha sp. PMI_526]|nr:MFS general substrate transporter [Flagelloscypha sp. PMI_526]